jgi:MFS family permease
VGGYNRHSYRIVGVAMSRILAHVGLLAYVLAAMAALLIWVPNFFVENTQIAAEWSWRYVAASGIPLGLLLVTIAARQSVAPTFKLLLLFEGLAAILVWMLCLKAFHYPPQANFFCSLHVGLCALFGAMNLIGYRREMNQIIRSRIRA